MDEDGLENLAPGDELRFKVARMGDFLITPFQCDLCHFRNITLRDPMLRNSKDMLLLKDIRQANLDAFWSREPGTVSGNFSQITRMEAIGDEYGLVTVSPELGPFPLGDTFGMLAAVCLLRRSLDAGRTENMIQFSTARKLRSAYSNVYHASKQLKEVAAMAFESTKTYSTACPTYGYWFERFMLGCHKRMGDVTVSDYALSIKLYWELVGQLERDWNGTKSEARRFGIAEFANLINFSFLAGLRGEEVMKVDLAGFLKYLDVGAEDPDHPHVMVTLLGRLKGETGERYHLLPMARVTNSGVMAGKWADRLARLMVARGRTNGWIFRDKSGTQAKIGSYNDQFFSRLSRIRIRYPHLFEPQIDIGEAYGLRRSLRRGSTTEAKNRGVPEHIVNMNNRWRKVERAKGRRPNFDMQAHYTEIKMALPQLWKYSFSF